MSLLVNTKYRTEKTEQMDDFSIDGDILHDTLDKLASINKWLGGNQVTISGLKILLQDHPKDKIVTIIDLGCGRGDIMRLVADFGKRAGFKFTLIGLDANLNTLNYAKSLSKTYENITYKHCDIFSDEFGKMEYDIVISTLFFHHFKDDELMQFLSFILNKASLGIVVNDLHRNPIAYYLFRGICVGISNQMVRDDGLTSVLKGFKRRELESMSVKIGAKCQIRWKWAFRYQWIIQKINERKDYISS